MEKRRKSFIFTLPSGKRLTVQHAHGDYNVTRNTINNIRRMLKLP